MRKVKLVLEYDGTPYAGWQVQENADTVQGRVEGALRKVLREEIRVQGAGRTDAGVHARGQVAHFETRNSLPPENIRDGSNTHLPPGISIIEVSEAPPDFHARYSAVAKVYRYLIFRRTVRSPFWLNRAYHFTSPLDLDGMKEAAAYLRGKHDFTAFAAAGSSVKNTVRELSRLEIVPEGELLVFEFQADGFLYRMARNIVGTLLKVGTGKIEPEKAKELLRSRDRTLAGPTAPAGGLYLMEVFYPPSRKTRRRG